MDYVYARNFDRSLFVKAGRYANGRQERFEQAEKELLDAVMKQGGLSASRSLISPGTKEPNAVDFAISLGERPFTKSGFSSLWLDVTREAINGGVDDSQIEALQKELEDLAKKRPDDDSVAAASALLAGLRGDSEQLRSLLAEWSKPSSSGDETDADTEAERRSKTRRPLLTLMAAQLLTTADENDQAILLTAFDAALSGSARDDCYVLAELGKAFLKRDDKKICRSELETSQPFGESMALDRSFSSGDRERHGGVVRRSF